MNLQKQSAHFKSSPENLSKYKLYVQIKKISVWDKNYDV